MRKTITINDNWQFWRTEAAAPEQVTLPHTWNNLDGQDGGSDYYRGVCRYERRLPAIPREANERVYVEVPAAGLNAEVLVNGKSVIKHEGGFSKFRADLTDLLQGDDTLTILADNAERAHVYPQFADFTFSGGLYRGVNLIIVQKSHVSLDDNGSSGVKITPRLDDCREQATVEVDVRLTNQKPGQQLRVEILAADGMVCACANAGAEAENALHIPLKSPRLWNGLEDPYLYTARVALLEADAAIDALEIPFGVRTFYVDPELGFFLNGKSYPLHGVSRHQCRENKGWAVSRADHEEDIALIREVGANTVRLAHYQHDDYFYELCDRTGMIVWAEIPYISRHVPEGRQNTVSQMTELLKQNWNHASVIFWGLSNEITMNGVTEDLLENHRILNDLCHRLDDSRLTTMACVSMLETDSALLDIPDVLSYNHYFGWYGASVEDNGPWLDDFHRKHPKTCLGLSEYGAEAVLRWHSPEPRMGDYSEEYQAFYHKRMLETFATRPYLWSTHVWNMFDFASDMRDEGGVKGRNNKGLVTFDRRTKKDSFYLYKAWWSKEPFVHIAGKRMIDRTGEHVSLMVYTNQPAVELYLGGRLLVRQEGAHVFAFTVPLRKIGKTRVRALAGACSDEAAFRRVRKANPEYSLETSKDTVRNWFDSDGNPCAMEYPDGFFSIRDSIGDILKNPEGHALLSPLLQKAMAEFGGKEVAMSEQMQKMMLGFSLERLIQLAGKRFDSSMVVDLNRALNKIKKG